MKERGRKEGRKDRREEGRTGGRKEGRKDWREEERTAILFLFLPLTTSQMSLEVVREKVGKLGTSICI